MTLTRKLTIAAGVLLVVDVAIVVDLYRRPLRPATGHMGGPA